MINKNKLFLFIVFSIIAPAFFFLLSDINYVKAMENKKQNATLAFGDYNFIAVVGDWYCNEETEKNIRNQYYEMTYPLLYNGEYEKIINKKIKPQPIVGEFHTNEGNMIDRFKLGET